MKGKHCKHEGPLERADRMIEELDGPATRHGRRTDRAEVPA